MANPPINALKVPLLFSLLALLVAGCGKPESRVEAGFRDQVLHVGNAAEPRDLDPQIITALTDSWICQALFENLVQLDPVTSEPIAAAAGSWDVSEDGLVYTFLIRPGARWSNGDPVTAQDFVWSFQRMLTPELAAEYAYMLWVMKNAEEYNTGKITDFSQVGVSAPAPNVLRIELKEPTPYFLQLIAHQSWSPVHRASIEKFGDAAARGTGWTRPGNLVGNGPFVLEKWTPNDEIVVKKNPAYWDAQHVGLNEIRFYPIDNAATEERGYRGNQLHVTYAVPSDKIPAYQEQNLPDLRIEPWLETDYLRVNVTRKPLDDVRVRRALGLAIDRRGIAEKVMQGGQIPANYFCPPNIGGYQSEANMPTDYDEARRLLADAGFPDGKGFPSLELLFPTSKEGMRIVEALQATWKKELNIEVKVTSQEFKVYLDTMLKLNYDLAFSRWIGDYADPNTFMDMMVTGNGNNDTGWGDPKYDDLIRAAGRTFDREKRFAMFQEAEGILMDAAPVIPIFFGTHTYLVRPEVKGYHVSPNGNLIQKNIRLEK